jgi:2-keto-4-pentenoate hydratase/2-oxohepta-3-ene-1,7-dioic acid hydratase in catechol pathway
MLFCDWSARDLQAAETRLNLGPAKGKDSANGFGPWLVTADEFAPLVAGLGYDVALTALVNGVTCSSGNLADLYWSFGEMISYAFEARITVGPPAVPLRPAAPDQTVDHEHKESGQ